MPEGDSARFSALFRPTSATREPYTRVTLEPSSESLSSIERGSDTQAGQLLSYGRARAASACHAHMQSPDKTLGFRAKRAHLPIEKLGGLFGR